MHTAEASGRFIGDLMSRRKNSVARVYIRDGKGLITINGKNLIEVKLMEGVKGRLSRWVRIVIKYLLLWRLP